MMETTNINDLHAVIDLSNYRKNPRLVEMLEEAASEYDVDIHEVLSITYLLCQMDYIDDVLDTICTRRSELSEKHAKLTNELAEVDRELKDLDEREVGFNAWKYKLVGE
jgi:hypothetical protein